MRSRLSRLVGIAAIVALALGAVVVGTVVLRSDRASATPTANRLAGSDRYDTARVIAESVFTTADTVLLARGDQYPDALAGNYLAGNKTAPILLSRPDLVPDPTMNALAQLKTKNVVLLGGPGAISPAVQAQLESTTSTSSAGGKIGVTRIGGSSRYETAKLIATTPPASYVGLLAGKRTAIVTSGEKFPDALAAGVMAFNDKFPLILTESTKLSDDAGATLSALGIQHVILLGGSQAVSQAVEDSIKAINGITVNRLFGPDRTATAVAIANFEWSTLGYKTSRVSLVRGDDFADALVMASHAALVDATSILETQDPNTLGQYTAAFFRDHAGTLTTIDVAGGPNAVSDQTVANAQQNATCGGNYGASC
jgi:putative cell wall-binding protein